MWGVLVPWGTRRAMPSYDRRPWGHALTTCTGWSSTSGAVDIAAIVADAAGYDWPLQVTIVVDVDLLLLLGIPLLVLILCFSVFFSHFFFLFFFVFLFGHLFCVFVVVVLVVMHTDWFRNRL
jgi:hypothetical protein